MKIYQAVQKLLVWDPKGDRQTGEMISLISILESGLKIQEYYCSLTAVPVQSRFL
jgi:hypothetical protein